MYLDSSAIVKLIVEESESAALERFLDDVAALASCGLARVEVPRAVAEYGPDTASRARSMLAGIHLVPLGDVLLDAAGSLAAGLRSLDAIHVTAARQLGEDLDCVVTYDHRMAAAAAAMGMTVASPS